MKIETKNRTIYLDFENKINQDTNVLIGVPVINLDYNAYCYLNEYNKVFCWKNQQNQLIDIKNINKPITITLFPTIDTEPSIILSQHNYIDLAINKYKAERIEIERYFKTRILKIEDKKIEIMKNIRESIENFKILDKIFFLSYYKQGAENYEKITNKNIYYYDF